MAEPTANTGANGIENQPANTGVVNNPGSDQGTQDPKWLQYIPEAERGEAKKSYMLNADYTKKTQEYSAKEKEWDAKYGQTQAELKKFQDWWGGFEPTFNQLAEPNTWKKVQMVLTGKVDPEKLLAQPQNGQQQQEDPFKDYDILPPQEQAKRMGEHLNNQYITKALQAMEQKFNQALQERETFYKNYLGIHTEAINRKFQNPDLPINEYLTKALEYSYGKGNPMEMAYNDLTRGPELKKQQEQWEKSGYERAKLELEQQRQTSGASNAAMVPNFRQTPMSTDQIREAVRQEATQKGIQW